MCQSKSTAIFALCVTQTFFGNLMFLYLLCHGYNYINFKNEDDMKKLIFYKILHRKKYRKQN